MRIRLKNLLACDLLLRSSLEDKKWSFANKIIKKISQDFSKKYFRKSKQNYLM